MTCIPSAASQNSYPLALISLPKAAGLAKGVRHVKPERYVVRLNEISCRRRLPEGSISAGGLNRRTWSRYELAALSELINVGIFTTEGVVPGGVSISLRPKTGVVKVLSHVSRDVTFLEMSLFWRMKASTGPEKVTREAFSKSRGELARGYF